MKKNKITPSDLKTNIVPVRVDGKYDWEKQCYQNVCKYMTSQQTCSGQFNMVDDNPTDNF